MAHEIYTANNGQASMAYVGALPWHGLGQQLTAGAPLEIWTKEAGFDWSALAATPTYTRADGSIGTLTDKQVIYRSDTGAALSVMGGKYKIVQPREVLGFFESLIEGGDFQLETAGVLFGGAKMWALAKNGHGGEVVRGDVVNQYLMLCTSLDGTTPTTAKFTNVRVVCNNTVRAAMRSAGQSVKVTHRTEFDADDVKRTMGLASDVWADFLRNTQILADKGCTLEQGRDILRGIFGQPVSSRRADVVELGAASPLVHAPIPATLDAGATLSALLARPHIVKVAESTETEGRDELAAVLAKGDKKEQKSVARALALFNGEGRGANHPGVKGTMWGLLNAVTEHVDHELGRTPDARLDSAWFGRGDAFKESALQALLTA
jgi:phage/plasmid-like protein (TIGR03299 family)